MRRNLNWRSDLYFISVAAFFLSVVDGYTPADPYEAFRTADSILTSSGGYSYDFRYSGTGSLANIIPAVLGSANLSWSPEASHPLMILNFDSIERAGDTSTFPVPSAYVASAESLYRFDYSRETITSAPATAEGAAIFDFPPSAVMMELVLLHPFSDELQADSIAVLFPDTIEGEPCHAFMVYYNGGTSTAVWHLSTEDLLPRAVTRGGELLEIWDLQVRVGFIQAGEPAPEVLLAGMDGMVERLSFPRERPLLLLFFTPGGSNSLAALGQVSLLLDENVDIRGILLMEPGDTEFRLGNLDIRFPIMVHGEEVSEEYRVQFLPSAVLIAPDGTVVLSAEGSSEVDADVFRIYLATTIL